MSKLAGPPATLAPGATFAQGYAVKDAGSAKAKASTIRFYASRGKKHVAGDELLGSAKVRALKRGGTAKGTAKLSLPIVTPAGAYYLLACADGAGKVKESNEHNNCAAARSPVIVSALPGPAAGQPDTGSPSAGGTPGGSTPAPPAGGSTVLPTLSIGDASTTEGDSGTATLSFPVTLSQASSSTVTVHWATADGTAFDPSDYTAASGDLSFTPGQTTRNVEVQVVGDSIQEVPASETFSVALSAPVNATLATATGTGTITDDDAGLSFNPVNLGNGQYSTGTVTLAAPAPPGGLTVQLSSSSSEVTVPGSVLVPEGQTSVTFQAQSLGMTHSALVTATVGTDSFSATLYPAGAASHAVINEVEYDELGTDNGEFVEIYNPTGGPISLANLSLCLVNGSDNSTYKTVALSAAGSSLPAGGYLVVADNAVTVAGGAPVLRMGASDQIQNGAPDGVALIDTSTNTLVDALSYEGSITAAHLPGFASTVSLVEGTALPLGTADSTSVNGSLGREPNGTDSDNASSDWQFDSTPTPGVANSH